MFELVIVTRGASRRKLGALNAPTGSTGRTILAASRWFGRKGERQVGALRARSTSPRPFRGIAQHSTFGIGVDSVMTVTRNRMLIRALHLHV